MKPTFRQNLSWWHLKILTWNDQAREKFLKQFKELDAKTLENIPLGYRNASTAQSSLSLHQNGKFEIIQKYEH